MSMKPSKEIERAKREAFDELPKDREFNPLADNEYMHQAEIKEIVRQLDRLFGMIN